MKKTTILNSIHSISLTKECFAILFFIFIFGLSTGVFFEVLMSTDSKLHMQLYLQNMLITPSDAVEASVDSFAGLMRSVLTNLIAIVFIALSGCTRFAYPVSSLILFFKGISLGYCCALILETLAFKGIFVIILSIFPQNTLLVPALFIAANIAITKSSALRHKKNKGMRSLATTESPYLYAHGFLCVIVIASCLLQSVFLPVASKLL